MRSAFTVFELTIVLCALGVLSAVAIPHVSGLLDSIHVRGAAMEIQSMFAVARHTAIARGQLTAVDIDPARRILSLAIDGDTVRHTDIGKEHGVSLDATRFHMSYAPTGVGYGAANLSIVVRRNAAVDTVFVSRLGRVRTSG